MLVRRTSLTLLGLPSDLLGAQPPRSSLALTVTVLRAGKLSGAFAYVLTSAMYMPTNT